MASLCLLTRLGLLALQRLHRLTMSIDLCTVLIVSCRQGLSVLHLQCTLRLTVLLPKHHRSSFRFLQCRRMSSSLSLLTCSHLLVALRRFRHSSSMCGLQLGVFHHYGLL